MGTTAAVHGPVPELRLLARPEFPGADAQLARCFSRNSYHADPIIVVRSEFRPVGGVSLRQAFFSIFAPLIDCC